MITASLITNGESLSDIIDYATYAEARPGGNGDTNQPPELAVGDGNDSSAGWVTWDSNVEDGFDTGWRTVELDVNANGVAWKVGGQEEVDFAGVGGGGLDHVLIRSMTEAAAAVQWRSLTVSFYKDDAVTDAYSRTNGPAVDESSATGSVFSEQILDVLSSHHDNDAIVVTGQFRMQWAANVTPGPTNLGAQIFAFAGNA